MTNSKNARRVAPPRATGFGACERCGLSYGLSSWYQKYCRGCRKAKEREWTKNAIAKKRDYYRMKSRESASRNRHYVKWKVFGHYSNRTFRCACCGESEPDFLTLDHVSGDGNRRSREDGVPRSGILLYYWLVRNDFPFGYVVLCINCNISKGHHGVCPHERNLRLLVNPPSRVASDR